MMSKPTQYFGYRRLEGYTGPISRISVDGVERDIFDQGELPSSYKYVKVYNQVDDKWHLMPGGGISID